MFPKYSPLTSFKQLFEQIHQYIVHNWPVHSLWLWELRRAPAGACQPMLSKVSGPDIFERVSEIQGSYLLWVLFHAHGVNPWACRMRLAVGISIRYELFLNSSILTCSVKFLINPQHFVVVVLWLANIICIKHLYWKIFFVPRSHNK